MESTYEKLQKEIKQLQHTKDVLNKRIEELSKEELQYLTDIPKFKKQAEDQKNSTDGIIEKTNLLRNNLSSVNNELKENTSILEKTKSDIKELREESNAVLNDVIKKRSSVEKLYIDVKNRESKCVEREKNIESKELSLKETEKIYENNKKELSDSIKRWKESNDKLILDNEKLLLSKKELDSEKNKFYEIRKSYFDQEEVLKSKILEADRIIKNNSVITIELELKNKKLDEETSKSIRLQDSLSRNISDLDNQRKFVKVMELRVKKLAHDAGIDKELQELEASLK